MDFATIRHRLSLHGLAVEIEPLPVFGLNMGIVIANPLLAPSIRVDFRMAAMQLDL